MNTLLRIGLVLLFVPSLTASELDSGDTAWILTATALVLFMTLPGLALFYGGLVRSKNVLSVLMQCFTIACLMSVVGLFTDTVLHLKVMEVFLVILVPYF